MITQSKQLIEAALDAINARLQQKEMNQQHNASVKEGYMEAVRILSEQVEDVTTVKERCHSVQSRAIAVLAIDFLHCQCEFDILCKVPIKTL